MKSKLFLFLILIFLATPFLQADAKITPDCGYDLNNDLKYDSRTEGCRLCHFLVLGNNILNFLFLGLIPVVAVIMLVTGGFMFIISGGNPGSLEKGKAMMRSAILGLIIIYGAWLAVDLFFVMVGVADWTGLQNGWFVINCPTTP